VFSIRKMSSEDFEFAVRLTDTMEWGLVEEDFEFMMKLEPDGCFILLSNSERVGLTTATRYGEVGWLGNIIVSEHHRGKGGGSLLVTHATEYLEKKGVKTIGLYAYLDRIPFYARHNFKSDLEFAAVSGKAFFASSEAHVEKADEADLPEIIGLDRSCFGESRNKLLEPILLNPNNLCYVVKDNGQILGFAVAKVYGEASEIGPLVCEKGCDDVAVVLLKVILSELEGCKVYLYLPKKETSILNLLIRHGFREDFRLARMFRGTPVVNDCIYLAESLERG